MAPLDNHSIARVLGEIADLHGAEGRQPLQDPCVSKRCRRRRPHPGSQSPASTATALQQWPGVGQGSLRPHCRHLPDRHVRDSSGVDRSLPGLAARPAAPSGCRPEDGGVDLRRAAHCVTRRARAGGALGTIADAQGHGRTQRTAGSTGARGTQTARESASPARHCPRRGVARAASDGARSWRRIRSRRQRPPWD